MRTVLRVVAPGGQKEARAVRRRVQRVAYRQLREVAFGGPVMDLQTETNVSITERTQNKLQRWTESEIRVLHDHPTLTSCQLSAMLPGRMRLRYAVAEADSKTSWGLPKIVAAMAKEEAVIAEMRKAASGGERPW